MSNPRAHKIAAKQRRAEIEDLLRGLYFVELDDSLTGADVVPTLKVYTDKSTVKLVQAAIAALPQAQNDPVLQIKADGIRGPKTDAAIYKFNVNYRGEAGDGNNITDGTLKALHVSPAAPPVGVTPNEQVAPAGAPSTPGAQAPSWLQRDSLGGLKNWQWLTIGIGGTSLLIGIAAFAFSGPSPKARYA